ncbi:hypothetical protein Moror_2662 [Moniliophthora roreri MCA 2997]|uniref:Heme haloperoxidase family profile domain-containing protein n=1 Tax=Moniliophthora roreri (strain MCA 2997) TaxID=1381753 RepID=V2YIE3_MONRO|nr:hypothetical protein Moror_2662 [Moniliophthora roreri MCA 2997]
MKSALLIASAIAFVSAKSVMPRSPHDEIDWSQHPFQAPGPDDARGPCPGLNTLANHGFLPRNGKNITIPIVLQGAVDGFNVQNDAIRIAAKAALFTSNQNDQFTLNDIKLHGNIEHDGSISRADHALGDNAAFNETYFSVTANSSPGVDYYNGTSAGLVFKERHADSLANNPNITNTVKESQIKIAEAALYLSVMGDALAKRAPKQFVNIFFREERLPLEEGWKRPGPISVDMLGPIALDVALSFQWEGPDPNRCPWIVLAPGGTDNPLRDGSII